MMLQRAHGMFFLLLGAVSVVDGWRIAREAREGANFDAIGPDRYLLVLGALMLIGGLWRLLRPSRLRAGTARSVGPAGVSAWTVVATLAMLAGFAVLTPVIGFTAACVLFLIAELRLLSGWPWWKIASLAATVALVFHVAFIRFADMPLPKGTAWE
jgi:hypothetical protein